MKEQKIRIYLKSYDHKALDRCVEDIIQTAKDTGALVIGPVPLPNKTSRFTVLKSPVIDKDAREQFDLVRHKRLIDIEEASEKTIKELQDMILPAGVDVRIEVM